MLTEGWDTNTVTHILGVRAFGTQLLCEQVVGRGLRRLSYDLNRRGPGCSSRICRYPRHSVRLRHRAGEGDEEAAETGHAGLRRQGARSAFDPLPARRRLSHELPDERFDAHSRRIPRLE